MKREIERRFLVHGEDWRQAPPVLYRQAYLHAEASCTVRVRVAGDAAWLTIKGRTTGCARDEFEYPIPADDASRLFELATAGRLEKLRRVVEIDGSRWEVDEFLGDNAPLVLAEIELEHEDQSFPLPGWLGPEVTHDARYTNARLAMHPFSHW